MSDSATREPVSTLDEVRALFAEFPVPDPGAAEAARVREAQLTKPAGALGRLEQLSAWLAAWQGRYPPTVAHPRVSVFAANHGIAARGVSAYPAAVTAEMVRNFVDGGAAVNQICQVFDADLRVYELDLDNPTADFTVDAAMTGEDCAHAMAYGMMAVEPGLDVLCLGEMGIGNTTSAAALCLALFGGEASDWTGTGTGVSGAALARKTEIVAAGAARHAGLAGDPLRLLAALGGFELSAICGAVMAARLARTPVLLDGFACTAAAAVLHCCVPGSLDHCQVAHRSTEPGHQRLLGKLGKAPLLDLGMRLGEGSGAALALGLLRAAVACHTGMATFEAAGVSGPSDS